MLTAYRKESLQQGFLFILYYISMDYVAQTWSWTRKDDKPILQNKGRSSREEH